MKQELNNKSPVCLSIAGLDPSGGAGIIADIKTFTALGCYGAAVVTSVTFQNTRGVYGAEHQTAASVRRQSEPVFEDFGVSAVKTGMLPTKEIIEETAAVLKERGIADIVVDPVVRSTSGFDLIDEAALKSLIETLFPIASVVTPNLQEAERISGISIRVEKDFEKAAEVILGYGAASVLIKGGHQAGDAKGKAVDRLFRDKGMRVFEAEFVETTSTHGTGCTLSAAIAANLAMGSSLEESVGKSKEYVTEAIIGSEGHGMGNSPVNHWAGLKIWGER